MIAIPSGFAQEAEAPIDAVTITFQLNDAFVRDRVLSGVAVEIRQEAAGEILVSGVTDSLGQFTATVPIGWYFARYSLDGYVPIETNETNLHTTGQIVTTSMSPMLEAAIGAEPGGGVERIQIVLNWGSSETQVRDADSHVECQCGATNSHVYYAAMQHRGSDHHFSLDVDDVDWGGPETITLSTPPQGSYRYYVHDYSGPPAVLGTSEIVVRVFFDNQMVGEYHVPGETRSRYWRPFASIDVNHEGVPRVVPFTPAQLEDGAHFRIAK